MSKNSKLGNFANVVGVVLMLMAFGSAQESVVGTMKFYPAGGSTRQLASSEFSLGGHSASCTLLPVWNGSDIQNGKTPTIVNTNNFTCTIDGSFVRDLILLQSKDGLLLTIHTNDGKCWSLLLVNSAGVRLTDLTGVYYKGAYAANSLVQFNLIGSVQ
jgi:hypothetical protein